MKELAKGMAVSLALAAIITAVGAGLVGGLIALLRWGSTWKEHGIPATGYALLVPMFLAPWAYFVWLWRTER